MPIELKKILAQLTSAIANRDLVLFIGAGISRQAKMKEAKCFPTWTELIMELLDLSRHWEYLSPEDETEITQLLSREKYLMVGEILKEMIPPDMFYSFVRSRFDSSTAQLGPIHRALLRLGAPLIVTTNFDLILEEAYAQEFGRVARTIGPRDAGSLGKVLKPREDRLGGPILFHLHGTIIEPEEIVFGERDYQRTYSEPRFKAVLSAIFVSKVVLMLGFSFSDPDLMGLIGNLRFLIKDLGSDYIVLPQSGKSRLERRELRQSFGLEVIEYEPSEGHPELLELVEYLAGFVPAQSKRAR